MILEVDGLVKRYAPRSRPALDGVRFSVEQNSCLGIAGESGSGKTTLAKILLKLIPATAGRVHFDPGLIRNFRKDVQIIFQNPFNSLNPKMRIAEMLAEPLLIHRIVRRGALREKIGELLDQVGMPAEAAWRYPREFSGGQRQRLCIARALASEPRLLVCDEPISSLDLTVQAKMLDLFQRLKERFDLTYIFISHNLAVIRHIADTVLIMKEGRIVEQGSTSAVFSWPSQEYTKLLIASARGA